MVNPCATMCQTCTAHWRTSPLTHGWYMFDTWFTEDGASCLKPIYYYNFSSFAQKSLIFVVRIMRKLVIIIILCTTGPSCVPKPNRYQFSRIDISQGCRNNQINTIFRDSKGFMWFGTMSGLNRYDGYTFTVFRHNLRTPPPWLTTSSSAHSKDPIILFGWRTGMASISFDPLTEKFNRNASAVLGRYALPPAKVINILRDSRGHFWFIMEATGLYKYDPDYPQNQQVVPGYGYRCYTGQLLYRLPKIPVVICG